MQHGEARVRVQSSSLNIVTKNVLKSPMKIYFKKEKRKKIKKFKKRKKGKRDSPTRNRESYFLKIIFNPVTSPETVQKCLALIF